MLEDYELDFSKPYAWLSWGGLILPEVVRNKDGSLMGFIRYGEERLGGRLKLDFPEGWALWLDVSHLQGEETETLCLLWNPLHHKKEAKAINGYEGAEPERHEWPEHFREVLIRFSEDVAGLRKGSHVLKNEEVLAYLRTCLHMERGLMAMPKVPLYLDAVLSKDMNMKLYPPRSRDKNRLAIKGREIVAVSLRDTLRESRLKLVLGAFRQMDYRFCRRLLLMGEERPERELKNLTYSWCSQRETMKGFMLEKQKGRGGLAGETIVFAIEPEELGDRGQYIRQILEAVELPFVMEDYNRKQCWWGSLPGMFRAGCRAWPRKIGSLEEFLLLRGKEGEGVQA